MVLGAQGGLHRIKHPAEFAEHPLIHEILDFIRAGGDRGISVPRDVNAPER